MVYNKAEFIAMKDAERRFDVIVGRKKKAETQIEEGSYFIKRANRILAMIDAGKKRESLRGQYTKNIERAQKRISLAKNRLPKYRAQLLALENDIDNYYNKKGKNNGDS